MAFSFLSSQRRRQRQRQQHDQNVVNAVYSADDLPFCDSDDKLLVRTGGVAVVQRRFQQKSAAAQRQQDAAMAKFDAHRRRTQASQIINAAHVKTLETPHTLLGPNEHLTKACCELATLVHARGKKQQCIILLDHDRRWLALTFLLHRLS